MKDFRNAVQLLLLLPLCWFATLSLSLLALPYAVVFIVAQVLVGSIFYRYHMPAIACGACIEMLAICVLYKTGVLHDMMNEGMGFTIGLSDILATHKTISIVIAGYNEHQYIAKTLASIYDTTPKKVLKEILIVDDASDPPMLALHEYRKFPEVTIIRHTERLGLTKSKTDGGNVATGDVIVFLDAHVKPDRDWYKPILQHINTNYRRVVVPLIPVLNGTTWEIDYAAVGIKMMFDWGLRFDWFDDGNDFVPCMSGGLFGISRTWWHESGEYDYDMQMWGAENIEQSIRVWLCGGEIVVARNAIVAHVFRPKFPYMINQTQVMINKVRTVETWFDEYKENYYTADPVARSFIPYAGDISKRFHLKERLHCKPFREYIDRFRGVFEENHMVATISFLILDTRTNMCVRPDSDHFVEIACDTGDIAQRFHLGNYGTGIKSVANKCLDSNAGIPAKDGMRLFQYSCEKSNRQQVWTLNNGQLRWRDYCALYSSEGYLVLSKCGNLRRSNFQKFGQTYDTATLTRRLSVNSALHSSTL